MNEPRSQSSESSIAELWVQMQSAYFAGDIGTTTKIGHELIQREPHHVGALHCLSVVANRQAQKELEFDLLRRVLAVDPNHVQALVGAANILRAKGKVAESAELCQRAIRRLPSYANAHNSLGLCRMSQNRPIEAAKCFRMALAYQPGLAAAQQNLSAALRSFPNPDHALAPSTAEDFENLGWLLTFQRKRTEAIEAYRRGLTLDPNSARLLTALADQLRQYGAAAESVETWQKLIRIGPDSAHLHCGLGYAYQDLGRFDDALTEFDRSLVLNPSQGDAYLGIATSRKIIADDARMMEGMRKLVPILSSSERVFLLTALSKCEDDLGNYEIAVRHMDDASLVAQVETGLYQPFGREWYSRMFLANKTTYTPEFFRSNPAPTSLTDQPVFLIGLPRSGTTLAEQMLSRHPQIAAAGELPFWSDQESILEGGLSKTIQSDGLSDEVVMAYLEILKGPGQGARRVIDKMPDNFAHMGFIHAKLPNARFIHCRRNPLDNCMSIYMTPFRNRPPMAFRREDILFYVREYQEMMRHWRSVIPEDRLLDLDYEEVVADPEAAMRRTIHFLGLEWDDACLRPEQNERSVNTPSSWQTRQPIYSTSVGRWKRYEPWLGALSELL